QQRLTFTGSPTGGTFILSTTLPTQTVATTVPITYPPFSATQAATLQASIQTALNNSAIGAGNTIVNASSSTQVDITFVGALAGLRPTQFTVTNGLTGGSTPALSASVLTADGALLVTTGTVNFASAANPGQNLTLTGNSTLDGTSLFPNAGITAFTGTSIG